MALMIVSFSALGAFLGLGAVATGQGIATGLLIYALLTPAICLVALAVIVFKARLRRDEAPFVNLGRMANQL